MVSSSCPNRPARIVAAAVCIVGVTSLPAAASFGAGKPPGVELTRVAAPTRVAVRDGVLVFGAYDPATRTIALMKRSSAGSIAPVGVPPIPAFEVPNEQAGRPASVPPFELTLGRDSGHRLTAVYRRCTSAADASCDLVLATIATGVERHVANTAGALRGAVSGPWMAFVKSVPGKADRLYLRYVGRRPMALAPPQLGTRLEPRGPRVDLSTARIAAVDIRGRDIAYVVNYRLVTPEIAYSELWINRGPGRQRKIGYVGTGGASSGFRELLQPRIYPDSVVSYMQGRDQTNAVFRYSLGGRVLGSGSIGWNRTTGLEITAGQFDRGHFWYSANPYQGNGCAAFDEPPLTATCPVLDSGPVTLVLPEPRT